MINFKISILGFVLIWLFACGASSKHEAIKSMKLNSTCKVVVSERKCPWDQETVTVRMQNGHSLETSIPLSSEAVLAILNTSDFDGSHGHMLGLSDCVFHSRNSSSPRGDLYQKQNLAKGCSYKIHTVGPDGFEYVLSVVRAENGVVEQFILKRNSRFYPDLQLLGS